MRTKANTSQHRKFIKSIKNAIPKHCSNCGYQYKEENLSIVQRDDYTAILHLTCGNCKESYLINVVSPLGTLQGSSRVPLKIDIITAEEAKRFIGKSAVSSDDVLNIHESLSEVKTGEDLMKLLD